MKHLGPALLAVAPLLFAGCARHVVAERNVGRIDDARSITTASDAQWTVEREPAAHPEPESGPKPEP